MPRIMGVRRCMRQHHLPKDSEDISLQLLRRVLCRFYNVFPRRVCKVLVCLARLVVRSISSFDGAGV